MYKNIVNENNSHKTCNDYLEFMATDYSTGLQIVTKKDQLCLEYVIECFSKTRSSVKELKLQVLEHGSLSDFSD